MAYSVIGVPLFLGIGLWVILHRFYPLLLQILRSSGMTRRNYQGESIPVAVGMIIPIVQVFAIPWSYLDHSLAISLWQTAFLAAIAYAGWRDDRFGGDDAKGLTGHVRLWREQGKISTGLWKAAVGSFIAMMISILWSSTLFEGVLHFLLVVLLTNLINLLDLRPGRATKGFFLILIPLFLSGMAKASVVLWLPVVFTAAFLFLDDVKGKIMLGDTGSNCLGLALGFWIVLYGTMSLKLVVLILAITVQVYAERRSLTVLIQNTPVLHWVDMLGRRGEKKPG